jgi:hypothetical protein
MEMSHPFEGLERWPYCPPTLGILLLESSSEVLQASNTEQIDKDNHLYDWS